MSGSYRGGVGLSGLVTAVFGGLVTFDYSPGWYFRSVIRDVGVSSLSPFDAVGGDGGGGGIGVALVGGAVVGAPLAGILGWFHDRFSGPGGGVDH